MKRVLILLACMVLLASCQADETFDFREEVGIQLKFVPDEASDEAPQSRSDGSIAEIVGEMTNIFDINVYLWNDVCRYHVYTTDKLILNLPRVMVGNYELRVICNAGYDLGDERSDLDRLQTADLEGRADHRAMFTHTSRIAVTQQSTSFDIEVTRIFARVYLHVTVADGVPLTLKAVTLHNVPTSGHLFPQPGSVDHPAAEHCRGTSSLHIPQSAKTTQDVVYIYENIKPDVPGISSQRERTLDNAPEGATYAYITATNSSGAAFNYIIFLGQNDTDNFSVRRNTSIVFQISIDGTSELDYRVSQVKVAATRHTDKYIDLQKYPTQEYAPVLGQYRFSSASAYDPLLGNCYATFTWRNGSDFPVACSTDNGRTRQPYAPGTELLLTAAGDYSVIFYGAWEKGDIPALGSDLSVVELRYGPGRTLLKSYAQQRCIGYSIAFTHVGIPDDLVDWNLTELDTNDGIDRTSTGSASLPPKFFVYTSTAMSFVEILYDESYPIQGLYANGVRLDIPEDGASTVTDYLTPDIPVSTFYKALGGSGVISARFIFQKYKNPVYLTVDRYDFAAIRVQIDGEYDVETNEELQQDIYTMEAGTQVTTRIEILDPASNEADRYIGIASTPVGGAEKVICEYLPATFSLERDTRLSAKLCRLVALDARGTFANCYIISEGYTRYTFNAQYGGSPDNWLPTATVRIAWANASMMTDEPVQDYEKLISFNPATGSVLIDFGKVETVPKINLLIKGDDKFKEHLWSWHLWIAPGYEPATDSRNLMTRNLGALTDVAVDPGSASTGGLYYQLGRTEPYMFTNIELGDNDQDDPRPTVTTKNNGITSSGTPLQFQVLSAGYPTATAQSWNTPTKSVTDPCPYGWRVATMNQILGSERYYRRAADQLLYSRDTYLPCFGAIYNVGLNVYITGSTTVPDRLMFGSYLTRSSRVFAGAIDSDASIGALHPAGAQEPLAGMVRCVKDN